MKLSLSVTIVILLGFIYVNYMDKKNNNPPINIESQPIIANFNHVIDTIIRKKIGQLDQTIIRQFSKTNSCYLPLVNDSSLFNQKSNVRFNWLQLFNDSLPAVNPYRNRYLVGDFMALNEEFESRGIKESNPDLNELIDFKNYD